MGLSSTQIPPIKPANGLSPSDAAFEILRAEPPPIAWRQPLDSVPERPVPRVPDAETVRTTDPKSARKHIRPAAPQSTSAEASLEESDQKAPKHLRERPDVHPGVTNAFQSTSGSSLYKTFFGLGEKIAAARKVIWATGVALVGLFVWGVVEIGRQAIPHLNRTRENIDRKYDQGIKAAEDQSFPP